MEFHDNDQAGKYVADAVLGIDTLWGGDVMCASGTGRFIADSWFSDEPLPAAYTHPAAARVRAVRWRRRQDCRSGSSRRVPARRGPSQSHRRSSRRGRKDCSGLRKPYLTGLAVSLEVMWDLAMEVLGKGDPVPYARSVEASTGKPPEPSRPENKRRAWPSCWAAPATRRPMRAGCWRQSMHGARAGGLRWHPCALWVRP